jgi:hypothetical protein
MNSLLGACGLCCLIVIGTVMSVQASELSSAHTVGLRKQLLVDDVVVAKRDNLVRELGKPTKLNGGKLIFPDCWWCASVSWDQGVFKMWYIQRDQQAGYAAAELKWDGAYAESKDGLRWTKKADLDCKPYGPVLIDEHETDPAHRYKYPPVIQEGDYFTCAAGLSHSADGIHWIPYNDGHPVTGPFADATNQILWDEDAKTYRMITREMPNSPGDMDWKRGIRVMTNPDPKRSPTNWTTVAKFWLDREGPNENKRRQIYHMSDWIHEGVHFGLMAVYEWPGDLSEGKWDTKRRHERCIVNFYIATSRDGTHFDFDWVYAGKPMLERGPAGSFDQDAIYPCPLLVTTKDKHWIYYCGARERHDAAMADFRPDGKQTGDEKLYNSRVHDQYSTGLATLRLDGFICLSAGPKAGTLETKPFKLEGGKLELNIDAARGEILVEVLDEDGQPIAGFSHADAKPVKIDDIRAQPSWTKREDLTALVGRVVRLRFQLISAKLYAFQVKP